ncbi:hypothetical protein MAM1_0228c08395 [Mucor ambiguus]|uniref:Bromo domain-containing protein n=1 Tax=Mucor ambiguus TaxID=91626 RepID=A0A0C9MZ53_9FUNG|nr:hypothetical protein MAM1_0228c08395 [Mucor ambiguus]
MSSVAQKRPFASLVDDEQTESTPPPSPPTEQPQSSVLMSSAEKKWCSQTIKSLKKHKRAVAFLQPVDPVLFNIPDYFDIIKSPMDLGTVEKKLKADMYPNVAAFKADVQLVFQNCYLYNNPGDPVTQDAQKLEEHYQKLCKKEPAVMQATAPAAQPPTKIKISVPKPAALATTTYNDDTYSTEYLPHRPSDSIPSTQLDIDMDDYTAPEQQVSRPRIKVKLPTQPTPDIEADALPEPVEAVDTALTEPTSISIHHTTGAMPEDQFKRCEAIVKELKKEKYQGMNWPFLNPVDADAWGASDYYDIIKEPMDMTTYERKLYEHQYSNEEELAEDIRLMFRNCYKYNPPNHLVHTLGQEFEEIFEKQWAKLHGIKKKSSKHHSSKRRRTSHTVDTPTSNTTPVQQQQPTIQPSQHSPDASTPTKNDVTASSSSSIKINTNNNSNNQGRSTILRLKLNGPNVKKEEEQSKPKPMVKVPGLALSKEPPSSTTTAMSSSGPKLAIGIKPPSPVKDKKAEKSTPTVLQNHDKWLALAKKSPTEPASAINTTTTTTNTTPHKPHSQQIQNTTLSKKTKELISPSASSSNLQHQSPPPPAVAAAAVPAQPAPKPQPQAFDINVIYNQINNQRKLKEQQKREEQDRWEKNEKIRLEKERIQSEARLNKLRELNQQSQVRRQQDKKDRQRELNAHAIDISKQKMMFAKFESSYLARDQDWREIYTWQRDTNDYRHIPVPGFVKRAPIKIAELRKRLLSKCVRLENSKSNDHSPEAMNGSGELSDMDVD